jgi:hypothetical protein
MHTVNQIYEARLRSIKCGLIALSLLTVISVRTAIVRGRSLVLGYAVVVS